MSTTRSSKMPLRLAVLTDSVSHFEAPLFRLCAQNKELTFIVFYVKNVEKRRFDSEYGQQIEWGTDLLAGYDSEQIADAEGLYLAARKWQADVVLVYGYSWKGAPKIILRNWFGGQAQIHRGTLNHYHNPQRSLAGRIMRPFARMLLSLFDAHHYGGDYSRKVLLDAGVEESSMYFVPYSVDTPYFLAKASDQSQYELALDIRKNLGWGADNHVILFIAHHNWIKGPDIAMAAFCRVAHSDPQARFLVAGSGRMTEAMRATAQQNLSPHSIHFAGFIPSAQTVPFYLASDLVICTSRYETWARMANEAMLCRRPCLVSRVVAAAGGLIVHGENGYVVDKPDAVLFADAVLKHFALTKSERLRMGDAAMKQAQIFAYETNMGNVVAAARYAFEQHNPVKPRP